MNDSRQGPPSNDPWTDNRIRDALGRAPAPEAPAQLREKLLRQIPQDNAFHPQRPRRRWLLWISAAAAACLLVVAGLWVKMDEELEPYPLDSKLSLEALPPAVSSLVVGNSQVSEHVSLLLDSRTVLVLWSGQNEAGNGALSTDVALYQETVLSKGVDREGMNWRWSLFQARPGIEALAQPPVLRVDNRQFGPIQFSVTPRRCPVTGPDDLEQCLGRYPSLPLDRIKLMLL